jgi:primosomal protein N' (replication factor Y)
MLAKGHHFAALSLVVVLDVDQGLYSPDFRSAEKTLQLLTQVAGRAGRSDTLGRVLIQTHLPDHPLLINWQQHSYQGVKATLMAERELYSLPPVTHMAILRADSTKPQQAIQVLSQLLGDHHANNHCQILGPLATIMEKRAGRHRAQLIIKSPQRKALHNTIEQFVQQFEAAKLPSSLRWSVDIDPQDVI